MLEWSRKKLGEMLVEGGAIDRDILDAALTEQGRNGGRLGEVLLRQGQVSEEVLFATLAEQLGIPFLEKDLFKLDPATAREIPARIVNMYGFVPLHREESGALRIAISDPLNVHVLDELRLHLKCDVTPVFATTKDIRDATKKYYGIGADTMEGIVEDDEEAGDEFSLPQVENIEDLAEDASIVRFVNQIIMEAIDDRATDIHFEPLEDALRIRYRIDGLLYEATVPPQILRYQAAIISRLKIMADMNIAERRLPQDGKIQIRKADKEYDLRVSTIPTPNGESIVMRILSRDSEYVTLEKVGFDPHNSTILRSMIHKPHGIVLVTGPTGSGKSTTLYAALNEINKPDSKIITLEDPIEYRIPGVMQIQINEAINLSFARCLRTLLRQDPDVIMVGETRDQETAEITIRTALTGHLVFSTLHTNDAVSAVTRLLDMGIEPFLISSSVEGLLAQRLVRRLCPDCKKPYKPESNLLRQVNVTGDDPASIELYRANGCEKCRYTGYAGRTAIYEVVQITEDFRRAVVDRVPANELKKIAIENGMRPLRHDGWLKCKAGMTTIEEVLRVTMVDEILTDDETGQLEDVEKVETESTESKPEAQPQG